MNYGLVILALFTVCAATASIFFIAQGNTPSSQYAYNDTWGNSSTQMTNATQGMVGNTTARVGITGSGLAFVFAGALIFVGIVYTAGALSKNRGTSGRGRY